MAYMPTEWSNGDVITAEKLNKIENGIDNATGYEYIESTKIVLFDGEVTTVKPQWSNVGMATLMINTPLSADVLYVTFNGTEYICEKKIITNSICYGAIDQNGYADFSEFPFAIVGLSIRTESVGTYSLKIETMGEQVITTHEFDIAVNNILPFKNDIIHCYYDVEDNNIKIDKSFEELNAIINNNVSVILRWKKKDKNIEINLSNADNSIHIEFNDIKYINNNVVSLTLYTIIVSENNESTISNKEYYLSTVNN